MRVKIISETQNEIKNDNYVLEWILSLIWLKLVFDLFIMGARYDCLGR